MADEHRGVLEAAGCAEDSGQSRKGRFHLSLLDRAVHSGDKEARLAGFLPAHAGAKPELVQRQGNVFQRQRIVDDAHLALG